MLSLQQGIGGSKFLLLYCMGFICGMGFILPFGHGFLQFQPKGTKNYNIGSKTHYFQQHQHVLILLSKPQQEQIVRRQQNDDNINDGRASQPNRIGIAGGLLSSISPIDNIESSNTKAGGPEIAVDLETDSNGPDNATDVLITIAPLHAKNNETVVASISLMVPHSLVVDDEVDETEAGSTGIMTRNSNVTETIVPTATRVHVDVATSRTQDSSHKLGVPSYRQLIVFCSTTFLIWLSEPLLSLVDTTVVGLTQQDAVIQLASLGPATTLIDSIMYLTYFLAIATTNQIAPARAMKDYKKLQTVTSHVLGVAVLMGLLCTTFVWTMARPVITSMAGLSGSPELISFATGYAKIRAAVAVCSVGGMTMQAVCLATLNTRTPSIAVLAASITNIIGDIALRKYGVIGAAIATAVSSVVSSSILFVAVRKCFREWKQKELKQQQKQQQAASTSLSSSSSSTVITINGNTLSATEGKYSRSSTSDSRSLRLNSTSSIDDTATSIPMISLPDSRAAFDLVKLSGPIFFVILSKIACYSAMTIRCTDFGVASLAAHSIMMRIFFFYGCFGDSLSQTAQSFLPATLYPKPNPKNFRIILRRLLVLAGSIGLVNRICAINILTRLGKFLTKDLTIIQLMKDHTHFIGLSILLHPFIVLLEGTVLASRDFPTLIKTYATTLPLHFTILKFFSGSFPAVWRTFFLFQTIRLTLYGFRVWNKQSAIKEQERKDDVHAASQERHLKLNARKTPVTPSP